MKTEPDLKGETKREIETEIGIRTKTHYNSNFSYLGICVVALYTRLIALIALLMLLHSEYFVDDLFMLLHFF
jgi:hypothetical protein